MNIVPTRVQEQISQVDRTYSLVIGISAGIAALWSFYRVFWLIYTAATFSSVGWSPSRSCSRWCCGVCSPSARHWCPQPSYCGTPEP